MARVTLASRAQRGVARPTSAFRLGCWASWWPVWGVSPASGQERWECGVDVLSTFPL